MRQNLGCCASACLQMYQCCQLLAELSGYTKGKMRLLREKALILGFWLFTYSFILIKLHQMGPKFGAFLARLS
jgi:hypothetical protein